MSIPSAVPGIFPSTVVAINLGNVATVASAGSSATDATLLTGDTNLVTGGDGTKGVILPNAEVGAQINVSNQAGGIVKVYPPTSGKLNGLTATTGSVSIAANKGGIFVRANSVDWLVVYA